MILDFADYGFNKSHGVAYSILAYYTAYLKTHYPLEFLAISMEGRKDDETELQYLAEECSRMKIKLRQPDINESFTNFKVKYTDTETKQGEIIYGLSAIKNVGEKASDDIVKERDRKGAYKSFVDFLTRVDLRLVNKKTVEGLIFSGAFDSIEMNRRKLIENLERATMFASRIKEKPESKGQHGLFSDTPELNGVSELRLEEHEEFDEVIKYNHEKAALGFYLTGHPLEKYRKQIENFVNLSFGEDINEIEPSRLNNAQMCGVISDLSVKESKRGTKFAIFNLIDFYGRGECVAFSKIYELRKDLFRENQLVFVKGKAEESGDKLKLVIDSIYSIDHFQETLGSNLTLVLDPKKVGNVDMERIRVLVDKNPGTCGLFFTVIENGKVKQYRSKEYKINLSNELISNLKNILGEDNLHIN